VFSCGDQAVSITLKLGLRKQTDLPGSVIAEPLSFGSDLRLHYLLGLLQRQHPDGCSDVAAFFL
jgi:hypothetical protein